MALLFIRLLILAALVVLVVALVYRRVRRPGEESPYATLGIFPGASPDEIKAAYRNALAQYHPDKVAHMGPELRDLAAQKTRAIISAYETLRHRHNF